MEEDGKEVIAQCESDKSVSRKYQNKALALPIYLFLFLADGNGRKSFPQTEW